MRDMTIETATGETHTLAATWKASVEIADSVGDPLMIARESALENAMLAARMPYQPKFSFTAKNVAQVVFIGLRAAGSELKLEDVQGMVFDKGLLHAQLWAADYIALLVTPKPNKIGDDVIDEVDDATEAGNG